MKQIKNYPNYKITEDGEIFSYAQNKPKKLKPRKVSQKGKYLQVSLYNNKCKRHPVTKQRLPDQVYIHDLVYEAFIGKKPENMTIDHIDNNPSNNHYTNLQLMTQSENSTKGQSKIRRDDLWNNRQEVIDKVKELGSQQKAAYYYNCSDVTIHRVVNGLKKTTRNGKQIFIKM